MKQGRRMLLLLLLMLLCAGSKDCMAAKKPELSSRQYLLQMGNSVRLRLKGDRAIQWKTSNPAVATVQNGKINTNSCGTAWITCTGENKKTYSCLIRVVGQKKTEEKQTYRVAHRGYSSRAPENTMASFLRAADKGYQYIECDIQFTKDNVPVILHDAQVDRTSNGHGRADKYTYAQLRKLDAGSWKSSKYAGEKIPSLQEVLRYCVQRDVIPYLELKNGSGLTKAKFRKVYKMVQESGLQNRVVWISFNFQYLKWVKEMDPVAEIGYIPKSESVEAMVQKAEKLKSGKNRVFLCIKRAKVSAKILELCKQKGIGISVRDINSEKTWKGLDAYCMSAIGNGF